MSRASPPRRRTGWSEVPARPARARIRSRGSGQAPRVRRSDWTTGSQPCTSLLRKLQPHAAVSFRIVAPPFAHLDKQEQVHLLPGQLGDFLARRRADRLDGRAAFAEHDLALALALDIDRLFDAHVAAAQFLPRFGLDRRLIG